MPSEEMRVRSLSARLGVVAVVSLLLVTVFSSSAFASRTYGEMVDYPLTFPVDGQVTLRDTFYAARSNGDHHAQDLMAPKMTPVVAAASGTVTYVNWSRNAGDLNPERCCTLVIEHDDGWASWYIHLNNDTPGTDDGIGWGIVEGILPGVRVEAGQHVGWVGDSGNAESTAPHLHFELIDPNGVIVNPYQSLLDACGGGCNVSGSASSPSSSPPRVHIAGPDDTLRVGSRGDVVADLQRTLQSLGFDPGPIDGIFGSKTEAAVIAFQTARGLAVDGVVGPQTKEALADGTPVTAPAPTEPPSESSSGGVVVAYGSYGSQVVILQSMLAGLGHEPGPIDGAFGPMTQAGVKRFQSSAGLTADGVVGQTTWDALVAASGGSAPGTEIVVAYGTRGVKVVQLQQALNGLGFSPGPIDGIFGPLTRSAVASFQLSQGLGGNGVVDQGTWDALTGS